MRRIILLLTLTLTVVAPTAGVDASPPEPIQFVLSATGNPSFNFNCIPNNDNCKHWKVDVEASGDVSGYFSGWFSYTENINGNPGQSSSTDQGDMTIWTDAAKENTIHVRFVGRADLDITTWPPGVTVNEQPWTIIGGTGTYSHLRGQGKRSTCTNDTSCVSYKGQVHHD